MTVCLCMGVYVTIQRKHFSFTYLTLEFNCPVHLCLGAGHIFWTIKIFMLHSLNGMTTRERKNKRNELYALGYSFMPAVLFAELQTDPEAMHYTSKKITEFVCSQGKHVITNNTH